MQWEMVWHNISGRLKKFRKRNEHELTNVLDNLDTLLEALHEGTRPEQLKKLGFVHAEPMGILAIDQKGPGKGAKLKPLRLYVFPDETTAHLHVIELGDKSTQSADIAFCKGVVSELLGSKAGNDEPTES